MQFIKFNKTISSTGSYVEINVLIAERMAHRDRKEDIEYTRLPWPYSNYAVYFIFLPS
jgi:hypothetical protein